MPEIIRFIKSLINRSIKEISEDSKDNKTIINSGKILMEERRKLSLTRRDLSIRTRVSVKVIEAIENGWQDQLPEKAYLRSLLLILEKELNMDKGTLQGFIDEKVNDKEKTSLISLGGISLLSNKYTFIIYIIFILFSIFAINQQQKYISIKNSNTIYPLYNENHSNPNTIYSEKVNSLNSSKIIKKSPQR